MNTRIHGQKVMSRVQPTTAAVALSTNKNRLGLIIRNNSSVTVYLGRSDVTATTGFPLKEDEIFVDEDARDPVFGSVDDWYAITASGTGDVRLIEYI